MPYECDYSEALLEQVNNAIANKTPLAIQGSNSKSFLGREVNGQILDMRPHCGIVNYDPKELIITARAGTPLQEIEEALSEAGQMLPCEPPHFGPGATWGGMVACGLAGPRRPWSGSVRDFVLGTRVITGHGKHLRFGGEVMKNVAGYDLSRLMAGSYGCLGVLTEISMKVLPKPRATISLRLDLNLQRAMSEIAQWQTQPLPISALCYSENALWIRLEGGDGSVKAARERLGGEVVANQFWQQLREQQLPFFSLPEELWRISLPIDAPVIDFPGKQLIDWGGAVRWLKSAADAEQIRQMAAGAGGYATRFRAGDGCFSPLSAPLLHYHKRLKMQLDPCGVFNPGRMYVEI
ncbi:TPA: glycolate oxidase subunit GlcE [Citrobacter freundii]